MSNQPTLNSDPTDVASGQPGNTSLAHRTRRRTTDLIAISLLLVVGLAVGRQLTAWWNETALDSFTDPKSVTGPGTAWTGLDALRLGELDKTIHRQQFHGDRQAAWDALETSTRATVREAGWPTRGADQDERQLLALLNTRDSRTSPKTSLSLHRLDGPLPIVVAVRQLLGERRVVGWGLATRSTPGEWVTWTCAAADGNTTGPVALPTGSRRLLVIGSANREQLLVFNGSPDPGDWWNHFERELDQDGWMLSGNPSRHASGWTTRWQRPGGRTLVISVRHDNSGIWHGMLNVFTSTESGPAKTVSPETDEREST